MARSSTRNFQIAFRSIGVDDSAEGPDVSQDVQQVYIVQDLRQSTYIDGGSGFTEAAVAGEHGFIGVACRVPGGMEIIQITMTIGTPADGEGVRVWTTAAPLPAITGEQALITALRTTGLAGVGAAPLSIARSGTVTTASIPTTAFRYVDVHQFVPGFWLNEGQNFNVAFDVANTACEMGIRWREHRLFAS